MVLSISYRQKSLKDVLKPSSAPVLEENNACSENMTEKFQVRKINPPM